MATRMQTISTHLHAAAGPCLMASLCPAAAVLREHKKELPTAMLALMAELDKYGPQFISKMLITIVGEPSLS